MAKDEPLNHYVLVGPAGKQPGRRRQKLLAAQLAAIVMHQKEMGGGLVNALMPRSNEELERLVKLQEKGYCYREVKFRKTIRSDVRNAAVADDLLVGLLRYFSSEKQGSRRAQTAFVKEFSNWIADKLTKRDPTITRLIERAHYDLPNRKSPDWWKKQINQNVKKLKK